ncbi:MAG: hypothetical protein K2H47_08070 [Muribaculaceae bacterium]|nr:hypothetical protein [Muribaculaceae bacterium]
MKKIFLSLAVIASVALVSCGGNKTAENNAEEGAAAVTEVAAEVVTDSACCGDSTCADTTVAVAAEVATPAK